MSKKINISALIILSFIGLISCVSAPRMPIRMVASQKLSEEQNEKLEIIAAQGRHYNFANNNRPKKLENSELAEISSAPDMELAEGQLITDNDAALLKKLELINNAQNEIRIVYYIYSDDGTSSEFNRTLLAKAQRTKVKLLVDFVTNYKNLDLFNMLAAKSNGNIEVRFYNYPTKEMFADAAYIAMPCPKNDLAPDEVVQKFECRDHKNKLLESVKKDIKNNIFPAHAQLFMSGLFGKNGTALKVALGYLAEVDPANYKKMLNEDHGKKIDKRDVIDLANLVQDALLKDQLVARIKLSVALATYEAELNPLVNELSGRLPLFDSKTGKLWDHFTDYTHHKLLMADTNQFILGGRNIEDSYHMKQLGKKGKYVFMDTDFWGRTKSQNGALKMAESFDRLFSNQMTVSLNQVNLEMPNDFIANTGKADGVQFSPAERAVGACVQKKMAGEVKDFAECLEMVLPLTGPDYANSDQRIEKAFDNMMKSKAQAMINPGQKDKALQKFKDYVPTPENPFVKLSDQDLKTARFYYLENTHMVKNQRITGSKYGSELQNNKKIHYVWYRSLENACVTSRQMKKNDPEAKPGKTYVHAIFHTAYLFMPAGLVHTIAKMMNNDWGDCSGVEISFISNSESTTDLGPINILARYQTVALFSHYNNFETYAQNHQGYVRFFPKLKYYEYQKGSDLPESLHTKTTLIGNDLIVGSANVDVRSYYMDSNNAVLIRNAFHLNRQYEAFVNKLKKTGQIMEKQLPWHPILEELSKINEKNKGLNVDEYKQYIWGLTQSLTLDHPNINNLNRHLINESLDRWRKTKYQDPKFVEPIVGVIKNVGERIMADTFDFLLFRDKFELTRHSPDMYNPWTMDKEHNERMQTFDDVFKLF